MYHYKMNSLPQTREFSQVFGGLNRQIRPSENEFSDMINLTSTYYPALSPRDPRGNVRKIENCLGLAGKDKLAWVDGNTLHYGDTFEMGLNGKITAERQLVSMGAYLIIFPDMIYLNTADFTDHGLIVSEAQNFEGAAFSSGEKEASSLLPGLTGAGKADAYALTQRIFAWRKRQGFYGLEGKALVLTGVPAPAEGELVATSNGYKYYYWCNDSILVNINYTGEAKIFCAEGDDGYLSLDFQSIGENYSATMNHVATVRLALRQKSDTASTEIQLNDDDLLTTHQVWVYTSPCYRMYRQRHSRRRRNNRRRGVWWFPYRARKHSRFGYDNRRIRLLRL